jgi:glycosyltransferase involved in cell wall biosynthesis
MAAVSGFDGLANAICKALGHDAVAAFHMTRSSRSWPSRMRRRFESACGIGRAVESPRGAISPFLQPAYTEPARSLRKLLETNPAVIGMLLAGEEQFTDALANAPPAIQSRLVIVLHQPPSWLRLHWRDFRPLDQLKAVVCLSSEQAEFLKSVCSAPVTQLLHGVAHDFFRPESGGPHAVPRLLLVGHWLRDFSTLLDAMTLVWREMPDVELDCVIPRHARNDENLLWLAREDRVRWHDGISADALRELYTNADLLFLPVIDATANNAVVEALACGVPVISTRVGGMPDYVTAATGELCGPADPASHAAAVLRWLRDTDRRRPASVAARAFAEQSLDWNTIASQLLNQLAG